MRSRKAIKNIASSFILQLTTLICGFVTPILIIKTYGSHVNGLMSSITQFLAYIALLDAGFGPVLKSVLYKSIANKNQQEICGLLKSSQSFFRKISFVFVIYIIILAITYPFIVINKFDFIFTLSMILIIAISTFFEYFFGITYKLFLQASQKTYITSNIQLVFLIINTILIVVLIKFGFGILFVKLVSSLIFVLRPIVQNIYVNKKYNFDLNNVKEVKIEQKWQGLSQHIAAIVHNSTDIAVLTLFAKDISIVSVYSVYYMVISGIKKMIQSFTGGIDASFGDMYSKGELMVLRKSFRMYELFYHTVSTVAFSCCFILIVPFVSIYTRNIHDSNYIAPVFAGVLVLSEFVYSIRLPYSSLTLAVGHFKETMFGAWVETIVNITISIFLVIKYGIVGVAIGTLTAMLIRTIEFMYHTNKYILNFELICIVKRVLIITLEVSLTVFVVKMIPYSSIINYQEWILYGIMCFFISSIIVCTINGLSYREDFMNLNYLIKKNIRKLRKVSD